MEEPGKASEFGRESELGSDQPREKLEELQLNINEKGPGIFSQGDAALESNQVRVGLHIQIGSLEFVKGVVVAPPSAMEFSSQQQSVEQQQKETTQEARPEEERKMSPSEQEFITSALTHPQSGSLAEINQASEKPMVEQHRSVDQPEKRLQESQEAQTTVEPTSVRRQPPDFTIEEFESPASQEIPSPGEEKPGGRPVRTRKLGAVFSMDMRSGIAGREPEAGGQEQDARGQEQEKSEDEIPDTFLESVNREIAADIQSQEARHLGEGGVTHKGGYGSQARAAAARNEPLPPLQGGRRRSRKYSNPLELASGSEDIGQAVHITVDLDKVTREEAAALQSIEAKFHGGVVPKGSLAAAAQAAAALNETPNLSNTTTPAPSGNGTPRRRSSVGSNGGQQPSGIHQPIAPCGAKGQTVHPHSCGLHVEQVADNALLIEANFDRITREDAAFIQALEAKLYGGVVPRGSLAAQAQAAAARNEPLPGQQPLHSSPTGGNGSRQSGRRGSFSNQKSQGPQGQNQVERVSEELGHIRLEADLDKVTRHEAAVLQSAEAQLHSGIIPKGSIAAAAQAAVAQQEALEGQQQRINEPQVFLEPIHTATVDEDKWVAKEDVGHIRIEADLSKITPREASVLQSIEAQPEGIAPRGGVASLAMSAAAQYNKSSNRQQDQDTDTTQQPQIQRYVEIPEKSIDQSTEPRSTRQLSATGVATTRAD